LELNPGIQNQEFVAGPLNEGLISRCHQDGSEVHSVYPNFEAWTESEEAVQFAEGGEVKVFCLFVSEFMSFCILYLRDW
jgi:hypothetical protein